MSGLEQVVAPAATAAPWTTAWQPALALVVLLVSILWVRREIVPRGASLLWGGAVAAAALSVRLLWIPVRDHIYDGHEADYLDLFLGSRSPTRGGTVLYPAMQWAWWLLGQVLQWEGWPVAVAVVAGVASVFLAMALSRHLFDGAAAVWTGLIMAAHGSHAFWSTSAYNVMFPLLFAQLSLLAAAHAFRTGRLPFTLIAAAAFVLSVATRLESVLTLVPLAGLWCWRRPPRLLPHLAVWLGALLLALAAVLPLVWQGGMPGDGQRWLVLPVNILMGDLFLAPFLALPVLLVLVAGLWPGDVGLRRRFVPAPAPLAILMAWAGATHLVMASFDDYGFRHSLPAVVALSMVAGAALSALRWPWALVGGATLGGALALDTHDISKRYYADEAAFHQSLPPGLPLIDIDERPPCTIVVEEAPLQGDPPLSHFNLLDPVEVETLRGGDGGCLQWCMDLQDWRWSSRGVRNRALRLQRMYHLEPKAVLVHPGSGYRCLLHDVGERRLSW